jgi:hypothetical protein
VDGEYKAPELEWDHKKAVQFYKNYLKQFWSGDIRPYDALHRDRLRQIFKRDRLTVGLLVKEASDFLRVGTEYLLSLHKRVFWQYFDVTSLVNSHLGGELPLQEVNEYEYVIISFHGGAHRPMARFMDLLVTEREIKRLHTLILSTAQSEWLGTPVWDPFLELDGSYKWPYTALDRTGVTIKQRTQPEAIPEGSTRSTTELPEYKDFSYSEDRKSKERYKPPETRAVPPSVKVNAASMLPDGYKAGQVVAGDV